LEHHALRQRSLEREVPTVIDWRNLMGIERTLDARQAGALLLREGDASRNGNARQTANVLAKAREQGRRPRRDVVGVRADGLRRGKSQSVLRIERHGQLLTEVIVRNRKAAAKHATLLAARVLAENLAQESIAEIRRPRHRNSGLKVVPIPVVQVIGLVHNDRLR